MLNILHAFLNYPRHRDLVDFQNLHHRFLFILYTVCVCIYQAFVVTIQPSELTITLLNVSFENPLDTVHLTRLPLSEWHRHTALCLSHRQHHPTIKTIIFLSGPSRPEMAAAVTSGQAADWLVDVPPLAVRIKRTTWSLFENIISVCVSLPQALLAGCAVRGYVLNGTLFPV
jgi:hypothetical protein